MVTRIPLDGERWRCKAYLGDEWRMRRAFAGDTNDVHGWIGARVPGSVVADLVRAGEAADPLIDRNSRLLEWVAERSWVYRRDVSLPEPLDDRRVIVHFEGIDHAGHVFWNSEPVGFHEGMFVPAEFDVTHVAKAGRNVVSVVLSPAPHSEPQVGRTDRVRTGKSRMTYGWDFCPRLVHVGLWDRAWVDIVDGVRIAGVTVRPHLAVDLSEARVAWEVAAETHAEGRLVVEVAVLRDGRTVGVETWQGWAGQSTPLHGWLDVQHPDLWWPNGHGDQPLYRLRVRARLEGAGSHEHEVTFGMRRIDVAPNATAPAGARPYTLSVNGQRVYLKGWNWVPVDIHHGVEDPDRLAHLIDLAARAHVNLLRVWGGGLIEKDAFYRACDRHGIMVWQEFPLSSSGIASTPSRDPHYIAGMTAMAERIVPRRRNHPSLVLWCGGNELADGEGRPLDDREPVLAALGDVVARLDPDRAWLPTSPTGPHATCSLEHIAQDPDGQHDVHGPWEHQGLDGQRTLYDRATSLLHSEFGVEGMTNLATLEAYLSPQHQWPPDRSNAHWVHRGDWWINTPLVQASFGGELPPELEALCRASQFLQAEGLRYAVEANRRRQWRNSGSIPWQFNEPFPNGFCTSAVDYRGRPKRAYYAVAEAYRPLQASAAFPTIAWGGREAFAAELWVSTGREPLDGRLAAALMSADGTPCHEESWDVSVKGESSACVASIDWLLDGLTSDVFWLDLRINSAHPAHHEQAATRYVFSRTADLAPFLRLPPTTLEIRRDGDALRIRNGGDVAALLVGVADGRPASAPGYARFSSGHFCLMPAEQRQVSVTWTGAPGHDRSIVVGGWNTGADVHA